MVAWDQTIYCGEQRGAARHRAWSVLTRNGQAKTRGDKMADVLGKVAVVVSTSVHEGLIQERERVPPPSLKQPAEVGFRELAGIQTALPPTADWVPQIGAF
ncbi:hypothetical protein HYQ46_003518 [Verticillium longisporum]|uniref:Uncharacterized protein n=1 Tax=Verticillium longisporum TaxID=100787 RepID=A0A0G4L2W5_VERLO|nr:hypothetical protein HYQ46_003518 [Verticillium longisporum]CRK16324.1 hypothetical protein BN1708_017481 [Verticillium longisporum]